MTTELSAGPRQTITRVRHPQRGDGIAVHRNGASFFQPDGGEPIAMPVHSGGGSSRPERSWMVLADPDHGRVEADKIKPAHPRDEHHERKWNNILGLGWLVSGPEFAMRFDADTGVVTDLGSWRMVACGTPEYVRRSDKAKSKHVEPTDEEKLWRTYVFADGTILGFRSDAAPPVASTEAPAVDPRQLGLFGGAR